MTRYSRCPIAESECCFQLLLVSGHLAVVIVAGCEERLPETLGSGSALLPPQDGMPRQLPFSG